MSTAELIQAEPNNRKLLAEIETQTVRSGRIGPSLELLLALYQHPDANPTTRANALISIVSHLRSAAAGFDPRSFGLDPQTPQFRAIYRGPRHHLDAAIEELGLLMRLQLGRVGVPESPKVIVALPKSGSSLLAICCGNMVQLARQGQLDENADGWRGYPSWWRPELHDWDLRADLGADPLFVRHPGGIYKGHVPPEEKNLRILELYPGTRYIVTVRDPRDQVVAFWCRKRNVRGEQDVPDPETVHRGLEAYMKSGELLEALRFAGKWLAMRDPKRSLAVTYEGFVEDPIGTLATAGRLFALDLPAEALEAIHQRASALTDREKGLDTSGHDRRIYPFGWTGRPGVWRRYFAPQNLVTFNTIFAAFCATCPWGEAIKQLYPDL